MSHDRTQPGDAARRALLALALMAVLALAALPVRAGVPWAVVGAVGAASAGVSALGAALVRRERVPLAVTATWTLGLLAVALFASDGAIALTVLASSLFGGAVAVVLRDRG